MGQQRIRKKRRLRIQKQNIPIVILSSITILLLFVWGGLYWRESTKIALNDPMEEYVQNWDELDVLPPISSEDGKTTPDTNSQASGQQGPEDAKQPAVSKQEIKTEQTKAVQNIIKTEQPEAPTMQVKDNKQPEAAKLTKGPVTKTNEQSQVKKDTPKQSEASDSIDTNSNTGSSPEDIASKESKYEQKLVELKAKCMKDMNVILEGAEKSIPQLDKTNPVEVQSWQDKITNEVSVSESVCERNYLDLIQLAEKDAVSASKIDDWTLTYNALIVKLQDESRAKLQSLMGV